MNTFTNLGLQPWIQKLTEKIGYQRPTKIQTMAIPPILRGENVIANAETGSGKTVYISNRLLSASRFCKTLRATLMVSSV